MHFVSVDGWPRCAPLMEAASIAMHIHGLASRLGYAVTTSTKVFRRPACPSYHVLCTIVNSVLYDNIRQTFLRNVTSVFHCVSEA